jgi:hypothetical protein
MELAHQGDEGPDAVVKLRAKAKGNPRRLRRAAAIVRFDGDVTEDRVSHQANRLLLAAAENTSVPPATAEEMARFDRIDNLADLDLPAAFERLSTMEPALGPLKERILDAARLARDGEDSLTSEDNDRLWDMVIDGLTTLLGPKSGQSDDLLASGTAFGMARVHLATVAGLNFWEDDHTEPEGPSAPTGPPTR